MHKGGLTFTPMVHLLGKFQQCNVTHVTPVTPALCFRGESLDNLDSQRPGSWRQSPWHSQPAGVYASSSVQDFSRPPPQLLSTSNRAYMRNPSSAVPPPAGSVKTSPGSPSPRSHSPSMSQSGSQLRNR
jgi:F-box protein 20